MKRDWDMIRNVLTYAEEDRLEDVISATEGDDEERLMGHLLLCVDAGLIVGIDAQKNYGWHYKATDIRLTMAGHDTLDALRSKTVWKAVKQAALDATIPITVTLIQSVFERLSKGNLS